MNEAALETKVPYSTIFTQCKVKSKGRGDYYFRFDDGKEKHSKEVVELNINGEYVRTYKNQSEVAKEKKTCQSQVHRIITGERHSKNYKLMYKDDYENIYGIIEEKDNIDVKIEKPKSKDIYVNILVGLANGTLIDKATYYMGGTRLTYNKAKNCLELDDKPIFTQKEMFMECNIELPLLLDNEKEFLSNLLRAFTNVEGIRKCKDKVDGFEFIRIETKSLEDTLVLPL